LLYGICQRPFFRTKHNISEKSTFKAIGLKIKLKFIIIIIIMSQFFINKICDCQQQVKLLSGVQHTELLSTSIHRAVSVGSTDTVWLLSIKTRKACFAEKLCFTFDFRR